MQCNLNFKDVNVMDSVWASYHEVNVVLSDTEVQARPWDTTPFMQGQSVEFPCEQDV